MSPSGTPPSLTDLRVFGIGVLVVAAFVAWRTGGHVLAQALVGAAAVAAALAVAAPAALARPYTMWMRVVTPIGRVVSAVLLALVYFAVVAPVGWIARARMRDLMPLDADRAAVTYWRARPPRPPIARSFSQY